MSAESLLVELLVMMAKAAGADRVTTSTSSDLEVVTFTVLAAELDEYGDRRHRMLLQLRNQYLGWGERGEELERAAARVNAELSGDVTEEPPTKKQLLSEDPFKR
jgi:hypothetical protein